jgi:hydrogenase maturation protein HypF
MVRVAGKTTDRDVGPPVTARKRVEISGIVQGVGFRPFVYRLAAHCRLAGWVSNTAAGVIIEVEGPDADLGAFLSYLVSPPPLARIEELRVYDVAPEGAVKFEIRHSRNGSDYFLLVPPDIATCDDCRRDFTTPGNRRYGYPFTNCTNCGPRYTIIRNIPYDRPVTTMARFRMCAECDAEYHDPANRRFHAEPNACPQCGPEVVLEGFDGAGSLERIHAARRLLHAGRILAIKGLGGFQLACDAENDAAVRLLRERKRRSDKPFAVMARDLAAVERFCSSGDADKAALLDRRRPIVILRSLAPNRISPAVAPRNRTLGVMLSYTPLHDLLFGESILAPPEFTALVMTSGNVSEEPIAKDNVEARQRLNSLSDHFLVHDRDIQTRVDDSVVRTFESRTRVMRRSRGYAPEPIDLGVELPEILACGADLKSTLCLTKKRYAILSQHIGDLENLETMEFFRETLHHMKRFFRVTPRVVAHDLHPGYMSTRFALEQEGVQKIGIQHHHAHIAACMAENRLQGKVIGVAFDGTGYGTDGCIWGGEFLVCDYADFERRAHLRYVPLAGGDAAIRQPWRVALAYLRDTFGQSNLPELPLFASVGERRLQVVERMITRGINTVPASSCGRLFDAVSSILGLCQENTYEGQAAVELEMAAEEDVAEHYPLEMALPEIDMRPTIERAVHDFLSGVARGVIAARFHNTVAKMVVEVCRRVHLQEGLRRVCLSGGTFQNFTLLKRTVAALRQQEFEVFLHAQTPPNDGGLSLGQAAVANVLKL